VETLPAWKPERLFDGESSRIENEAARWLITLDGQPTVANFHALNEWLSARARHRAAFLRLSVAWGRMDRLRTLRGDARARLPHRVPVAVYIATFAGAAALTALVLAMWLR
jgi:ferric-dicitrate binding protein FerR (iron transport regulator)